MERFNIPVALIIFKRPGTVSRIINKIKEVNPEKIYLLSDNGRDDKEIALVEKCREAAEKAIDWDCQVIKKYADENIGVHANIGLGAKWVFEREDKAIFLEDDNLPETTFFPFCKQMLERYKDDRRILWICGTNYLEDYKQKDGYSYMFSKHLLPCGWASWSDKFNKFYDTELTLIEDDKALLKIKKSYEKKSLCKQQLKSMKMERDRKKNGERFRSWDFHMVASVRANELYGLVPNKNQIENIGVDGLSEHGGNSMSNVMTRRFCGIKSYPMEFPLVHPVSVIKDKDFEARTGYIILLPLSHRIKAILVSFFKIVLFVPQSESLSGTLKKWFGSEKE